jgi:hypothetical protein
MVARGIVLDRYYKKGKSADVSMIEPAIKKVVVTAIRDERKSVKTAMSPKGASKKPDTLVQKQQALPRSASTSGSKKKPPPRRTRTLSPAPRTNGTNASRRERSMATATDVPKIESMRARSMATPTANVPRTTRAEKPGASNKTVSTMKNKNTIEVNKAVGTKLAPSKTNKRASSLVARSKTKHQLSSPVTLSYTKKRLASPTQKTTKKQGEKPTRREGPRSVGGTRKPVDTSDDGILENGEVEVIAIPNDDGTLACCGILTPKTQKFKAATTERSGGAKSPQRTGTKNTIGKQKDAVHQSDTKGKLLSPRAATGKSTASPCSANTRNKVPFFKKWIRKSDKSNMQPPQTTPQSKLPMPLPKASHLHQELPTGKPNKCVVRFPLQMETVIPNLSNLAKKALEDSADKEAWKELVRATERLDKTFATAKRAGSTIDPKTMHEINSALAKIMKHAVQLNATEASSLKEAPNGVTSKENKRQTWIDMLELTFMGVGCNNNEDSRDDNSVHHQEYIDGRPVFSI